MASLSNYDVSAICVEPFKKWMRTDHSIDDYVLTHFADIERLAPTLFLRVMPFWQVANRITHPDPLRLLHRRVMSAATARLESTNISCLWTWGQWHSVHLVGAALKRLNPELPWIAYFSDPWSKNSFKKSGRRVQAIDRRLEEIVLSRADQLIFSTDETLTATLSDHPEAWLSKASVLPHCFDPSLFSRGANRSSGEPFVIRYIGGFYGNRTPRPLIEALHSISHSDPGLLKNVRVELIGPLEKGIEGMIRTSGLRNNLLVHSSAVDYRDSLELMWSADLLLIIDAPAAHNNFLPSKLIDYIGAERPIFGITPPGTSRDIIMEIGGRTADPSDQQAICSGLTAAIREEQARKKDITWGRQEVRDRFSASSIATDLENLIDRAKARAGDRPCASS